MLQVYWTRTSTFSTNKDFLKEIVLNRLGYKDFIFGKEISGKPYLEEPSFQISLSHTKKLMAVALSDEKWPVGLDIESRVTRRYEDRMAKTWMPPLIYERYARIKEEKERTKEFYRFWTQYEAYAKYLGKGIGRELIFPIKEPLEVQFLVKILPDPYESALCLNTHQNSNTLQVFEV